MTRTSWVVHRFTGVILALLICHTAVACADEDPNRSRSREANEREGGGGAPFGGEGGQAVGAPFKVPAITQLQGRPFEEVKEIIEQAFLEACGTPELCVKLVVDDRPIEGDPCDFHSIEPPEGTEIQRGSTVTIVVVAPCPGGSPPPDETTDEETPDEETQDDESQDQTEEESQDQTDEGSPPP